MVMVNLQKIIRPNEIKPDVFCFVRIQDSAVYSFYMSCLFTLGTWRKLWIVMVVEKLRIIIALFKQRYHNDFSSEMSPVCTYTDGNSKFNI